MMTRSLGMHGPRVSAIGLGCAGMSDAYGPTDEESSLATIHAAIDSGITLLDTADFYGMGHNEMLLREALRGRGREQVVISDKFGGLWDPKGRFVGIDGRPASVKNFLAYTLRRLGTDYVDIYRPARLDPTVPIEETIGAIADMVKAGHVRFIGLSEVGSETLRRAQAVHPISDVQTRRLVVLTRHRGRYFPYLSRAWYRDYGVWCPVTRPSQRTVVERAFTCARQFRQFQPALQGSQP